MKQKLTSQKLFFLNQIIQSKMDREYLISFILLHNTVHSKKELEELSTESLIMIQVHLELELINKKLR